MKHRYFKAVNCSIREKADAAEEFENRFTASIIGNVFFAGRVVLRRSNKTNLE